MKKAIATAPGKATKYTDLTSVEISSRQDEEAAELADKPMNDWEQSMKGSDQILPRWAEDIIDKIGTDGLAPETVDKHAAKKALRATRPV